MESQCRVLACSSVSIARDWCWKHWRRWRRHGDPHYADASWRLKPLPELRPTSVQRFWAKVTFAGDCWLWDGARTKGGYGVFGVGGLSVYVHRYAYEFCVGKIPDDLTIDHLCRVRHCVNPDHLEPVSMRVNTLRSPIAQAAINARKTHCIRGHEFTLENTYVWAERHRRCRTCTLSSSKAAYQRRKEAALAV